MACDVTITEVKGILAAPGDTVTDSVRVTGTASECASISVGSGSFAIHVSVDCGNGPVEVSVPVVGGNWQAEVKAACTCGERVLVTAICITDPACRDTFDGPLDCEENACPTVVASVAIGPCNADGTRSASLTANFTSLGAGGPIVVEWDYGDGTSGSAFAVSAIGTFTEGPHAYAGPGPFPAQLNFILPAACPPVDFTVDLTAVTPCPAAPCPDIVSFSAAASGLCNADSTRDVTLSATLSGGPPQTFHWEFGTPDSATLTLDATVPGTLPVTTHAYPAPGTGVSSYTATFTVTGTDPSCVRTETVLVTVAGCGGACPTIDTVTASVGDCDASGRRSVVLDATLVGGGFLEYQWVFGDGDTQTIDATITGNPQTSHAYTAPGSYTATLTATTPGGCDDAEDSVVVAVPACGDGGGSGGGNGGGGACGSLLLIVAALLIIATGATLFTLALSICPPLMVVPVPGWVWGIVAGLWVAAGAAVVIWLLLCAFGICDCPSKCDWAAIGWMTSLAGAIIALYLAGCCSGLWWLLVIGLGVAAVGAFTYWVAECDPTPCRILDLMLVVFASVAATAITYIAAVPVILTCGFTWVEVAVATIVAALAVAVPTCHSME